jgi:hypothetical protein
MGESGGSQRHSPAALPMGKIPGTHCTEAGWALAPVWLGPEDIAPPWFETQTIQLIGSCYTD